LRTDRLLDCCWNDDDVALGERCCSDESMMDWWYSCWRWGDIWTVGNGADVWCVGCCGGWTRK
jgi:hypothetical protein